MNLRKLAKGKPCMVRIPSVCNHNPETTVLAHLGGGGMGMKHPDLLGAWCCSDCHDVVDGRRSMPEGLIPNQEFFGDILRVSYFYDGIIRTQQELLKMGLAKAIDDWKEITEF